jgi:tripartite-type tricarboxylate transporter receptor subunit TctC
LWRAALCAGLAFIAGAPAFAADYPEKNRPVKLLVGYPAGGGTDRIARIIAQGLTDTLGTSVVVENRTGATGTIAANAVAKAPADGYTLMLSAGSDVTMVKYTTPSLPYNIYHDFAPVGRIAQAPYVLITNKHVPGESLQDLVQYIRRQPNPTPVAAAATISRLTADLFRIRSGLNTNTILYGGSSTPMKDLLGNQLQVSVDVMPSVLPQVRAGTVKARAVAATKRSALLPNVQTTGEGGYPDVVGIVWYCLLAPKGTPPAVVQSLQTALQKVLASPDAQRQLLESGYEPYVGDTPAELEALLAEETERWGQIIKLTGIDVK